MMERITVSNASTARSKRKRVGVEYPIHAKVSNFPPALPGERAVAMMFDLSDACIRELSTCGNQRSAGL
jgi:hypothetical protein